jgi:hypothetical protein
VCERQHRTATTSAATFNIEPRTPAALARSHSRGDLCQRRPDLVSRYDLVLTRMILADDHPTSTNADRRGARLSRLCRTARPRRSRSRV